MKTLTINPVSRIEGEGKITVYVDDAGRVERARFQMLEFRGFENFLKQRSIWEMPLITSKICGICPIPHHLAAVKAAEAALGVTEIPSGAVKLRKLLLDGAGIQDHALHFLYLAFPDFIFQADKVAPENRGVVGLFKEHPELVKKGIFLRKCGVTLMEATGGHGIYPTNAIPGGMSKTINKEAAAKVSEMLPRALKVAEEVAQLAWKATAKLTRENPAKFSSKFMSLIGENGGAAHYDGSIIVIDEQGRATSRFDAEDYEVYIEEGVERDTWAKFPFLKKLGTSEGVYRVGPLARLNAASSIGTPRAEAWLAKFKELGKGQPLQHMYTYHLARCIELVHHIESAIELIRDPEVSSGQVRIPVQRVAGEGVGAVEAPRGLLLHHYRCDDKGEVEFANLVVPTTHNNTALNESLAEVAAEVVTNGELDDVGSQKMEMAVRAYDPCLSCATHGWSEEGNGLQISVVQSKKCPEQQPGG